jgi:hypothetical protein
MSNDLVIDQQSKGTTRPSTSKDIQYRAYGRPYDGGPGQVITLLASCSYPVGGYAISFTREYGPDEVYTLMEKVPGIYFNLVTYLATSYCSGAGLASPVKFVTIIDANGKHQVAVEDTN